MAILSLYEMLSSQVSISYGLFDSILRNIEMNLGYPLSPTLFGLYIDELEYFILEIIVSKSGCLIHGRKFSLLLFGDNIVLFSHFVEGL